MAFVVCLYPLAMARQGVAITAAMLALLCVPGVASATNRYVDETGTNGGNNGCLSIANPCQTIAWAISKAAFDDDIFVDDGTYAESNLTIGDVSQRESLRILGGDFNGGSGGKPLLDAGSGTAFVIGPLGGLISNMEIRGDDGAVVISGPTELVGNTFSEQDDLIPSVELISPADDVRIEHNNFIDPDAAGSGDKTAVTVHDGGAYGWTRFYKNDFDGFRVAVRALAGQIGMTRNDVTDQQDGGAAVQASDAGVTLLLNRFEDGNSSTVAVELTETSAQGSTSGTLERNTVLAQPALVATDAISVWMGGDAIQASTPDPVTVIDTGADDELVGRIRMTNVTVRAAPATAALVKLQNAALTMDSTLLETAGSAAVGIDDTAGTNSCTITYSYGPTTGSGCDDFDLTSGVSFAGPLDYHLAAGSTTIDAGNPAYAGDDGVFSDIDGDARLYDATQGCPLEARRDIGADEWRPPFPADDCLHPLTELISGPSGVVKARRPPFRASYSFAGQDFVFPPYFPGGLAGFECSLDGAAFTDCSSPHTRLLDVGTHVFRVRAYDTAGLVDETPAARSVTVVRWPVLFAKKRRRVRP